LKLILFNLIQVFNIFHATEHSFTRGGESLCNTFFTTYELALVKTPLGDHYTHIDILTLPGGGSMRRLAINRQYCTLLRILLVFVPLCLGNGSQLSSTVITDAVSLALEHLSREQLKKDSVVGPRSIEIESGNPHVVYVDGKDWCSGFFSGILFHLASLAWQPFIESKAQNDFLNSALNLTLRLKDEATNADSHDLGFKMMSSFGIGLEVLRTHGNEKSMKIDVLRAISTFKETLLLAAKTLCKRFSEKMGVIKSWDNRKSPSGHKYKFPVIIDSMMNLQLLFWAFGETKDLEFLRIATSHANKTIANHFRTDGSTYHVVDYGGGGGGGRGEKEGRFQFKKMTHQGLFDESTWTRGQAWSVYGFAVSYRETGIQEYLEVAIRAANFVLNHPLYPHNGIPPWDFSDTNPNALLDASAASILSAGLLHLSSELVRQSRMTTTTDSNEEIDERSSLSRKYKKAANVILETLLSKGYLSQPHSNFGFLLQHAVGQLPQKKEVDTSIIYADYYFIEALSLTDMHAFFTSK